MTVIAIDNPDVSQLDECIQRARGAEEALKSLEGRWKITILTHLFARPVLRFSDLERAIPGVSQKMLTQQLRGLERDGIVMRTVYPEAPPRVEYALTEIGADLAPALRELLRWGTRRAVQRDSNGAR